MSFAPDYVDVAERIREFRDKHPDGSLQQVDWEIMDIGEQKFVVYTAAAYRTPDDERPGHGTAWEPFPGKTAFTRDSELMNAETSAWGRAIIAAGAADAKRVASANEVANRSATPPVMSTDAQSSSERLETLAAAFNGTIIPDEEYIFEFGKEKGNPISAVDESYLKWLLKQSLKDPKYAEKHTAQHAIFQAELDRRAAAVA